MIERKGLYGKFRVERTDGKSEEGEKHHDCDYFVLDLTHDPFAYHAILAYARKCGDDFPELAEDLYAKAAKMGSMVTQAQLDAMTSAERKRWHMFVHNDPERR